MSISVQQLVQTAFQNCSLIGDGESVDGTAYGTTAHDGALGLLNNLLGELNNQELIASSKTAVDITTVPVDLAPIGGTGDRRINFSGIRFVGNGWDSWPHPEGIILNRNGVPDKIDGVSRRIGDRWVPLHSCNFQQMMSRNFMQLATSWTYNIVRNDSQDPSYSDVYGILALDTNRPTPVRIFFSEKIPVVETGSQDIYLSDMYFDLLLNGLCVKLCIKYKLTDYLPIFEQQFKQAKNLIKRSNATQRMIQRGDLGGGYNDSFYNGLGGVGW
jgi:hypothetical protein